MDAGTRFVAILNSISSGRHRTAERALRSADVRAIDIAFNILVLSEGIRDMALVVGVPKRWEPRAEWGVLVARTPQLPHAAFVASAAAMDRGALGRLVQRYADTRERPRACVEREVGRRLGYLQPTVPKRAVDGAVAVHLVLPDGRTTCSEYGPQSVHVTPAILRPARELQQRLDGVAKALHPGMSVRVTVILD